MATTKDDRIFQSTRMIAGFVIFILLLAFTILYIFPQKTDVWFSWTIKPGLMSMLMGAGYLAGAFFFYRVFITSSWHRVQGKSANMAFQIFCSSPSARSKPFQVPAWPECQSGRPG